jgi:hypothetical protein
VNRLNTASNSELDPATRLAMFKQMQDLIMAEAPGVKYS